MSKQLYKIMRITDISYDCLKTNITIKGWIQTIRKQQAMCFLNVNDGSNANGIQIICPSDQIKNVLNKGCYIELTGKLVKSPAKGQEFEIVLKEIIKYSECDINTYPLKKRMKLDTLRKIPHLRTRTKTFGAVFRIRNTVMFETHNFYQTHKYLHLDPNVLTVNECEGGAGVFQATEWCPITSMDIPINEGLIDWTQDHFKRPAYLTVSSQLQLEAMACSLGNVYTTNKSFRAEHSQTNKHVSEFTHLEIESINCDNNYLMDIGIQHIQYIIGKVFEKNYDDIKTLDAFVCKGLLKRFEELLKLSFYKVSYIDCIQILRENGFTINFNDDISSEMENFLCKYYDNGAVFITNWPFGIKSFYMKQNDDKTCECFDLLMPYGIGELIGGSMREHRLNKLQEAMTKNHIKYNDLEWYLDLRRYGTVEHGGFGMGLDRLIMLVSGMKNIKDVVPFPVYYQNCKY